MIGSDAWDQLTAIRDLSNKTQTLHEAQVINLKMWPFLAVPQSDPTTGQIELSWQSNTIQFVLKKAKGARKPKKQEERLQKLDEAVKELLGNWWTVQVTLDGKVIFNGKPTGKPRSNLEDALRFKRNPPKDGGGEGSTEDVAGLNEESISTEDD